MRYQWRQFSEAISRPVEAHIEVQFSIIRGWVHSTHTGPDSKFFFRNYLRLGKGTIVQQQLSKTLKTDLRPI